MSSPQIQSSSVALHGVAIIGAALLVMCAGKANAQVNSILSAYATVSNDYIKYGISRLDSGTSIQTGVDFQHHSGLFVGGTAANVSYEAERGSPDSRDSEIDIYAGHTWARDLWSVNLGLHRYIYPSSSGEMDYSELRVSVVFKDRFFAGLAAADEYIGRDDSAYDAQVGLAWPLPQESEVSAAVGRYTVNNRFNTAYTHWNLGVSKIFGALSLDLRYYDSDYRRTSRLGADPDGLVLSVSYGWNNR